MDTEHFRALAASLEAEANELGDKLINADHALKLATRRALISGEHAQADEARDAMDAIRIDHRKATDQVIEARALLAESIEADRNREIELARDELRVIAQEIAELGPKTDQALATFAGLVASLRRLEREGHLIVERRIGRRMEVGTATPDALTDAATYLRGIRGDNGATLQPFNTERANLAAKRLINGAGIVE
ncbi:hypothetical protein [Falsiroseomonas sp.]|uniref:hypothetical protein n=1 Tax=Falsiroseomonas sp. TaxID=2870721 RepID=UPI002717C4D8|nr:hypothetical protein [Falsiroseomonas sp.]MDO9503196.1 hypothetical protein [Falsiroseomonas sp.]